MGVPPKTTVAIMSRPQVEFRGWRLMVHRSVASSFLIHEARVGNTSAFASYAPIPADAFLTDLDKLAKIDELFERDRAFAMSVERTGAELLGSELHLPRAQPCTDIQLYVENISSAPARFCAGMLGFGPEHGAT